MADGYLKNVNLLVVEDNDFDRRIITNVLKVFGARQVSYAHDGKEAWELFKNSDFDLVLTDWIMEPVDGIALARRIRDADHSPNPFIPIIMVTARSTHAAIFKARDAGVTEIVVKPLSPHALYSRIHAVIERPRPFVKVGGYFGPDRRRRDAGFSGEEKRGKGSQDNQPAVDLDRTLGQDEINAVMNPGGPEAA
jgi:two-component system chemotaxis response regulator CheY